MKNNDDTTMAPAAVQCGDVSREEKSGQLAEALDQLAGDMQRAWLVEGNFARTIAYGLAVGKMREALDNKVMVSLMKLKGSKLGFRTDEGPKVQPYPMEVVRDCIIDAVTLGLQCVGNQFNILGGNMYVTKEGFTYLLRQLPGLQDLKMIYHPAEISESSTGGARRDGSQYQKIEREGLIAVDVSCQYKGRKVEERLEFVVKVNAGMTQDAIIGKAERKARAWLYNYLTDSTIVDGDAAEAMQELRDVTPARTQPRAAVVTPSFLEGDKAAAGNDAANASVTEGTASRFQDAPVAELTAAMSTRLAENPAKPDEIPGMKGAGDVPPFGEVVKG